MDEINTALQICPEAVVKIISGFSRPVLAELEEIRLRNGQPLSIVRCGKEQIIPSLRADSRMLTDMMDRASKQSAYSVQELIKRGFLTVPGGHRLGICGRGIYKGGSLFSLREISSLNLRIAREIPGAADRAVSFLWTHPASTLIIGPPGRGKTTLLRDLIRQLSDRFSWRVCVSDERFEIASCVDGLPQFSMGEHTDILSGIRKDEAIEILLRTMNPQWIAVDEITAFSDVEEICRASYCGVRFLATAHAACLKELESRPVYRKLMETRVFRNLIFIESDRSLHMEVVPND